MQAVKIVGVGQIEVKDVPIPVPGDNEVLVKLKASALCRSDLHLYHGESVFEDSDIDGSTITPGHEPCGVVEKVGKNVQSVKPGDRVAVYLAYGCSSCSYCLAGDTMLCDKFRCMGFDLDGGHADYLVTPEYNCLPLPDEMTFLQGAVSTDVGGTLYTACRELGVDGTQTVVIFGIGPMGCGGVLMAKGYGAKVIAIDVDPQRLKLAQELGADIVINPKETDSVAEIKRLTKGMGADVAIDCTGSQIAQNNALDCVKPRGKVGFIGESKSCTINPSDQFIRKLIDLKGLWYFNRADWNEITDFIIRNNVAIEKISSHTFPIEEAAEAFKLFDSRVTQKVVFLWD
ncbi:zinc-binding dehydrogenase [Paenibacillus abyssi]|uniref:Oxidoreductase n=1 Tax=Paenibacillus abyssi TaxID=1340531 RepID=A0A917LET1_9BACL|nr:zinc-binding dehydrogenase [Paenibacillus abyssi]GGG16775.1 oxidoreductase [Paenibacillus abyssi]